MPAPSNDGCRFCKLYAIALVAIACLLGAVQAINFSVGLAKFGGQEYVWRLVLLSAVRSHATAVNGSALALALLLWSHQLAPSTLALELPGKLKRGLLVSVAGYPVAVLLLIGVSLPIAAGLFGVPLSAFRPALGVLGASDLGVGYASTLIDAAVIALVAWRALPVLHASKLSLPAKIGVAWAVLFVVRSVVGLLLPGSQLLLPSGASTPMSAPN